MNGGAIHPSTAEVVRSILSAEAAINEAFALERRRVGKLAM